MLYSPFPRSFCSAVYQQTFCFVCSKPRFSDWETWILLTPCTLKIKKICFSPKVPIPCRPKSDSAPSRAIWAQFRPKKLNQKAIPAHPGAHFSLWVQISRRQLEPELAEPNKTQEIKLYFIHRAKRSHFEDYNSNFDFIVYLSRYDSGFPTKSIIVAPQSPSEMDLNWKKYFWGFHISPQNIRTFSERQSKATCHTWHAFIAWSELDTW